MDLKVVWSPEAIEDLESIAEYIGRDLEFYGQVAKKPGEENVAVRREEGIASNWEAMNGYVT